MFHIFWTGWSYSMTERNVTLSIVHPQEHKCFVQTLKRTRILATIIQNYNKPKGMLTEGHKVMWYEARQGSGQKIFNLPGMNFLYSFFPLTVRGTEKTRGFELQVCGLQEPRDNKYLNPFDRLCFRKQVTHLEVNHRSHWPFLEPTAAFVMHQQWGQQNCKFASSVQEAQCGIVHCCLQDHQTKLKHWYTNQGQINRITNPLAM
jgi:hypothetical protein